ncbi:malate dehydrogenase, cytoplasmic-like [Agrilus planipennis]|uniref:Malate dehydrogenase, cytoplasmic n=1 Tax=Agrilus planipennis TaxID=224129 RepID=A0A1W4XCY7_AGRPL|nr:malate dehydrogenase, cytoplasmic-like [Agrilus planipennis]
MNLSKVCQPPLRVLITGAAGQVAYHFVFMLAKGDGFGRRIRLLLILYDLPETTDLLEGLCIELIDCCYPTLQDVVTTSNIETAFTNVSVAFLIGGKPCSADMKLSDLVEVNTPIFKVQGLALDKYAKKTARVIVVANPANTNLFICSKYAPSIPKGNFSALTQLDCSRLRAQIARKLRVTPNKVRKVLTWGSQSPSLVCDVTKAVVVNEGKDISIAEAVDDDDWLKYDLTNIVRNREEEVMNLTNKSPSISAAKALLDHTRSLFHTGNDFNNFTCMGVFSDGSYGIPEGMVFSFPVHISSSTCSIVQGIEIDEYYQNLIDKSICESEQERDRALRICVLNQNSSDIEINKNEYQNQNVDETQQQ